MRRIAEVRQGLATIPGSTIDFPPEPVYPYEPGVHAINTIWSGEDGPSEESKLVPNDGPEDTEVDQPGDLPDFEPVFEIGAEVDETLPALNGSEGELIHQNVLHHHGTDALGGYLSFHLTSGRQWGIYIPVTGLAYLVGRVFARLSAPLDVKWHLAFHAILNHELFHFAADCAIAQAELVNGEPWWVPTLNARLNGNPKYLVREEKLANAYMLKASRTARPPLHVAGKQRALREFTLAQPQGYREGATVRPQDWDRELALLAHEYGRHSASGARNSRLWNPSLGYDWPGQFPIWPKIDWRYCPIHIIDDGARLGIPPGWITFFACLVQLHEPAEFQKKVSALPPPIQRAWFRQRDRLRVAITPGADFKRWDKGGPDVFSLRVNDGYRAHVRRERVRDEWVALDIGTHKQMGHD